MLISKARAEVIRKSVTEAHGWKSCATPEEDAAIKAYWNTLPGSTSFYDAVCSMAQGIHLRPLQNRLALSAITGTTATLTAEEADFLVKTAF